jgi:preprotein translocase subunit YajC
MGKTISLALSLVVVLLASVLLLGSCVPTEDGGSTDIWTLLIFLVLGFGVFYFLIIRPQRRRQQSHKELMAELRVGDRVVTIGGIYGRIESLREDSVVLKTESGAMLRIARNSIGSKQGEAT